MFINKYSSKTGLNSKRIVENRLYIFFLSLTMAILNRLNKIAKGAEPIPPPKGGIVISKINKNREI